VTGKGRGLAQMVNALPDLTAPVVPAEQGEKAEQEEPAVPGVPAGQESVPAASEVVDSARDTASSGTSAERAAADPALKAPEGSRRFDGSAAARPQAPSARKPSNGTSRSRKVKTQAAPQQEQEQEHGGGPRYLRFEPKTVRMTAQQIDALQDLESALRRRVRGRRRRGDDLISWNMLARIGIDLVLREAETLAGMTENELRASVGLEPLDW
jgi:hypothetical protein